MSRVGLNPILLPDGVSVIVNKSSINIKGPKGEITQDFDPDFSIKEKDNILLISRPSEQKRHKSLHGLYRALINNCVIGVSTGFEIILDVIGTGYRVNKKGKDLEFSLGFSHSVLVNPIGTNELSEENQNIVFVRGSNKQTVGEQAARIRKLRKPNPYTGNGVKYRDEIIRRKAGKTAVGGEA